MSSVDNTLVERGNRYGRFEDNAAMSQHFKWVMRVHTDPNGGSPWARLSPVQKEALDQIACKLSRIFSGDPDYIDNWHDIAGYASLAEEDISERKRMSERSSDAGVHGVPQREDSDIELGSVNNAAFYPPL